MITRYVGVFCKNDRCHYFIGLSSYQTDSPYRFGTDVDPTTSEKGITCPKCASTYDYLHSEVAHSDSQDGSDPRFQQKNSDPGRAFVRATLEQLAEELNEAGIKELDFERTSKDFDEGRISIVDRKKGRVVAKIGDNDLADSPSNPTIRSKLEAQLIAAIRSYYHKGES